MNRNATIFTCENVRDFAELAEEVDFVIIIMFATCENR